MTEAELELSVSASFSLHPLEYLWEIGRGYLALQVLFGIYGVVGYQAGHQLLGSLSL